MQQILILKKTAIITLVQFIFLLALATLAPLLGHQSLTGSLVNAVLFIATVILGAQAALLIGLMPSLIALSTGLLPAILAPMIPFIMTANAILVTTFNFVRKKNYWLAVLLASIFKFFFLALSSSLVIELLAKKEIAQNVALMMSWPQLITALSGGVLAYFFLKIIKISTA